MKRNEAIQFRKMLEAQADSMTDEKILEVPAFVEHWKSGTVYQTGKRLNHNGIIYKVLQDHTSQSDWTPDSAPSLFAKVLIPDENVIPEWEQPDSTNPYMTGDKVTHNGVAYESLVDGNVWEPGTVGTESLWKIIE